MELNYTTEKSEKETIKLFLRRRGFLKDLRQGFAIMSVIWLVGSIFYWSGSADSSCGLCQRVVITILGTAIFLCGFFLLDKKLVQVWRRAYRQRETHKVEYRLTNDALALTAGETSFSSPWSKVAKKFRIDKKAIYLYGKNLPFEAQCIPDWWGHGMERKKLIATLKKAGLKKGMVNPFKFLVWQVVALVGLVMSLTIYFYIGGIEWRDCSIPDEAQLRLEVRDVPDKDNAYVALFALTNIYHVAENDDGPTKMSDQDFVRYYGCMPTVGESKEARAIRNDPASPERAARILADNAEFFEAFHAALSLKEFREKEEGNADFPPMLTPLPRYAILIHFVELVKFKAQVALERGDLDSAVSAISEIHTLGQMVSSNCNMSMVGYVVGNLIEKISYEKMCDTIAMGKISDEIVEKFEEMMGRSEANAQRGWERAMKVELAIKIRTIEWFCNLPENSYRYNYPKNDCYAKMLIESYIRLARRYDWWPGMFRFCFHRREMISHMTEHFRSQIAHKESEFKLQEWWMAFFPNGVGRIIETSFFPVLEPYFQTGCLNRIRPRLVIAAEKWRRAHGGETPPTLEALVPDYLAAVPRDPWSKSGEPIKYDAALGVAWSIGKDGTYDFRKTVQDCSGNELRIDYGTQEYAFRLDGKPIAVSDADGCSANKSDNCESLPKSGKSQPE